MNAGTTNSINDTVELLEAIDDAGDPSSVGTYQAIGITILDAFLPGDEPPDRRDMGLIVITLRGAGYRRSVDDIELCIRVALNYRDLTPEVASQLSLDTHRLLARVADVETKEILAFAAIDFGLDPEQLAMHPAFRHAVNQR